MLCRLRIVSAAAAAALACAAVAQGATSLVPNGTFDADQQPWGMHWEKNARAAWSLESVDGNPAAAIAVTASGKSEHVQFACPFPSATLVERQVYELSFRCRATSPRTIRVVLIEQSKPWRGVGVQENVRVGTVWNRVSFAFRGRSVAQENVKIDFFLGAGRGPRPPDPVLDGGLGVGWF